MPPSPRTSRSLDVERLREALHDAGYTVARVDELLGVDAAAALGRHETTPALRRTGDRSPLSTLTRLWPLQAPVAVADAEAALPGLVDELAVAGLLQRSVGEVRAVIDIRPYADEGHDWWVASDLTPGLDGSERRMRPDHVLGVTSASSTLAQLVDRRPVGRALDLGTGSGVQSVHLSTQAGAVVATDVNPRCLDLADLTAQLNNIRLDLRHGSLYEPVAAELFDLVVSNPPFVVSSGSGERLVYRDSGLPGDELARRVVVDGARRLTPGGSLQVLANWVHEIGTPWDERVSQWVGQTGCDAWVVQRERLDVARYVELWLDDAGLRGAPDYIARYDAWLGWFAANGIDAVGLGWVTLRNAGRDVPAVRVEDWPYEIEQPLGPHVAGWANRVDTLAGLDDDALLATRLVREPDVVEERMGRPGDADPAAIVLRGQRGMRRVREVTTLEAALVGACDGDLTVGQIGAAVAEIFGAEASSMLGELVSSARTMVLDGFLSVP